MMSAHRARFRPALDVALFVAVAGAAPVRRVAAIHQGYGVRALALAVIVVAVGVVVTRDRGARHRDRMVVVAVVVTSLLGAVAGGRIVGVWLVVTTLLAVWVVVPGTQLGLLRPFDRRSAGPVVAVSLVAAFAAGSAPDLGRSLGLTALAWVLALVLAERADQLAHLVTQVARGARVAATTILLLIPWIPFVLIPWILQRIVRRDPLEPVRSGSVSSLIVRSDRYAPTARMWFPDPAASRPSWGRRIHRRSPALLVVVAVLAALWWTEIRPLIDAQPANPAEEILRATDGFAVTEAGTNQSIAGSYLSHFVGVELTDQRTDFVSIEGGRRVTWRPPNCEPPAVSVWIFGGSTLFGVYHRDDWTIPSELARLAAAEGVNLRVENYGVPGDVAWQMNRRLERALAIDVAPDLVVFYDGWNDLRAIRDMDFTGRSESASPDFIGPLDRLHLRVLSGLGGLESGRRYVVTVPEVGESLSDPELLDLAVLQYETAHETAEALSAHHDFEFVHVYQPNLYTRAPRLTEEPNGDSNFGRLVERFHSRLPAGVVDLSSVLDDADVAYYDEVHVTEQANGVIAAGLWDQMSPRLIELSEETGAGPCR